MPLSLFEWVDKIYTDSASEINATDADWKSYNRYMVNRLISMNYDYVDIANLIQKYDIDNRTSFLFYNKLLPKGKQYNKYIKASKKEKYEEWIIKYVANYFEISLHEAEDYIDILYKIPNGKQQLRTILEMFGVEEKQLKKAKL